MICHAFKHFLHSGFGIRQVCDIVLFANAYGREIGQKYLTFDPSLAGYPQEWQEIQVDEQLMLDDLLDAGCRYSERPFEEVMRFLRSSEEEIDA